MAITGSIEDEQDQAALRMKLAQLQLEHDCYHTAIEAMTAQMSNPLQVQRMKKKKLDLKDQIGKTASRIIPDIIA